MAATNLQESSYKQQRVLLVGSPQQRDGTSTKDQRFVNFFPELVLTKTKPPLFGEPRTYYLRKRPGTSVNLPAVGFAGRGTIYFNNSVWRACGANLFRDGVFVQTLSTSTGTVGFSLYEGTYSALIICDGISGWVVKTDNTITKITDVNFPTPHVPHPVSLDGYVFVAKAATADIFNCNVTDPLTWSAAQFITAEMYPQTVVNLTKNQNYLYAIGTQAIEYFSDAGIATGSPLALNAAAVQQFGCPAPESVVQTDIQVLLIGENNNGGRTVYSISGFKADDIGNSAVSQSLDILGTNIVNCYGLVVRSMGHKWYILNLPTGRTWVYDFDSGMWHEWSYIADGTAFSSNYSGDHPSGYPLLVHNVDGTSMLLNETTYTDYSPTGTIPIVCTALTKKFDADTSRRKSCNRLLLVGDCPNGITNTPYNISWSDDDYNTFSTPVTLQMNPYMAAISQLGIFRRRAFLITYNQPYPSRLEALELMVNIGNY
jgi:hypothetical protein